MSEDTPSRISVSRDALRAELAEMELRLRVYFDERLGHKAEATHLLELAHKFDRIERGEFTPAQQRALDEHVEQFIDGRATAAWTWRERIIALITATTGVATAGLYFVIVVRGIS